MRGSACGFEGACVKEVLASGAEGACAKGALAGGARGGGSRRGRVAFAVLAAFFALSVGFAVFGGLVPLDGDATVGMAFLAPSPEHLLGTDKLGRDVLARVLHGGARLLGVSLLATLAATGAGALLGFATSGRSRLCRGLAAAVDLLAVIPAVVTLMVLVFGLGAGAGTMALVAVVATAPYVARYMRSVVRPVLESDYVVAARLSGDSLARVAVREVLPNVALPLATDAGQRFIGAVYLVASAAFLGFDPLGGGADWATMIQEGMAGLALNPWATLAPALALACVTVSGNLLVDRLGKLVEG